MRRIIKQTRNFVILSILFICLSNNTVSAQKTVAANPNSISQNQIELRCKAGSYWYNTTIMADDLKFATKMNNAVSEVLKAAEFLPNVIKARAAYVSSVTGCRSTEDDYILYNPAWLNTLYKDTDEYWADRFVIAHEVGHFRLAHLYTDITSSVKIELEADEYAGEILAKMGGTLKQAQATINSKKMQHPSGTSHPSTEQRLAAVEKGWRKVGGI